jgi:AmmeMemoRadiSam system protein A
MTGDRPRLDDRARRYLLELARQAIVARLAGRPLPATDDAQESLSAPRAAFVSLHAEGDLRGCIGIITAVESLASTVARCAASAATEDPRFTPLESAELAAVSIEISVLGPRVPVKDPSGIVVGRHGLMVTLGSRRGLLLPQVAAEHGWDPETFLRETCRKAGLGGTAWKKGAVVETFEAEVFSEAAPPTGAPPRRPPRSPE